MPVPICSFVRRTFMSVCVYMSVYSLWWWYAFLCLFVIRHLIRSIFICQPFRAHVCVGHNVSICLFVLFFFSFIYQNVQHPIGVSFVCCYFVHKISKFANVIDRKNNNNNRERLVAIENTVCNKLCVQKYRTIVNDYDKKVANALKCWKLSLLYVENINRKQHSKMKSK